MLVLLLVLLRNTVENDLFSRVFFLCMFSLNSSTTTASQRASDKCFSKNERIERDLPFAKGSPGQWMCVSVWRKYNC